MVKPTYYSHIDLLRVFFVFVVLLHHWVAKSPFAFLPFGSTIAFVLSGFLLSEPLIVAKKNKLNYWKSTINFLARRLLRTLPIYLIILLIYLLVNRDNFSDYIIYFLTFTQNYLIAEKINEINSIGYTQTWSLAIQEQFYFFLPILIYFTPYKYLMKVFISLSILGLTIRLIYFYSGFSFSYNHFNTECCLDCFGIGSIISFYHLENPTKLKSILSNKLLFAILIISYLCSTLGYFEFSKYIYDFNSATYNNLYRITERTFVSLISVWFIAWGIYYPSKILTKVSTNFVIKYLSKISYGIYIYHFLIASLIMKTISLFNSKINQYSWWVVVLNFIFTILISSFSYELIEKHIILYKDKYFRN
jgi:peptidoglycan/LPS O-acetylase OafA/YrhL